MLEMRISGYIKLILPNIKKKARKQMRQKIQLIQKKMNLDQNSKRSVPTKNIYTKYTLKLKQIRTLFVIFIGYFKGFTIA